MGIWRNHLFAVLDYTVEVFQLPYFDESTPFVFGTQLLQFPHISTERLGGSWIVQAYVYEVEQLPAGVAWMPSSQHLFISVRDRQGRQYIRAITQLQDGSFAWDAQFSQNIKNDGYSHRHCNGNSCEYQLRLVLLDGYRINPGFLHLVRPHRTSIGDSSSDLCLGDNHVYVVSTPNLPDLDLTTTMDFDDGAGVILLGSCLGEIFVIQFTDNLARSSGALSDDLPTITCNFPELDSVCLSSRINVKNY